MPSLIKVAFRSAVFCGCLFVFTPCVNAALVIQINYAGDAQYQSAFTSAASTWQSLLTGYQNGLVTNQSFGSSSTIGQVLSGVTIAASIQAIDGAGGILGQAGFTAIAIDSLGYTLASDGIMQFDSADFATLSSSQRQSLILHEMAHVLGFGTLWTDNNVYIDGSGEFTGANATAFWQSEFGQTGTPNVELGGGLGTANAHWNEPDGGGSLTGITDGMGRDMTFELMTGWLNPNSFISNMTVASFKDIGFTTSVTAVPEPSSLALLSLGSIGTFAWQHRRSKKRDIAYVNTIGEK